VDQINKIVDNEIITTKGGWIYNYLVR